MKKIQRNGTWCVGNKLTLEVTDAGTLYLGINDYNSKDNSGEFSVSVVKTSQ